MWQCLFILLKVVHTHIEPSKCTTSFSTNSGICSAFSQTCSSNLSHLTNWNRLRSDSYVAVSVINYCSDWFVLLSLNFVRMLFTAVHSNISVQNAMNFKICINHQILANSTSVTQHQPLITKEIINMQFSYAVYSWMGGYGELQNLDNFPTGKHGMSQTG